MRLALDRQNIARPRRTAVSRDDFEELSDCLDAISRRDRAELALRSLRHPRYPRAALRR